MAGVVDHAAPVRVGWGEAQAEKAEGADYDGDLSEAEAGVDDEGGGDVGEDLDGHDPEGGFAAELGSGDVDPAAPLSDQDEKA